jgi:hypothetical protein
VLNLAIIAIPAWCLISSRGSWYHLIMIFVNHFFGFASPHYNTHWTTYLKGFILYLYYRYGWTPFTYFFIRNYLIIRLRQGFRPVEIVVRKPTGPSRYRLIDDPTIPPQIKQTRFTDSIYRATNSNFLMSNTGINTRIEFWELDFIAAEKLQDAVRSGLAEESAFKTSLFVKTEAGWQVWPVWKTYEDAGNLFKVSFRPLEVFCRCLLLDVDKTRRDRKT